jgi:hypothetical protein
MFVSTLHSVPVQATFTIPATMFDPELTIHADGTVLMMIWEGGRKGRRVMAMGVTQEAAPYRMQTVVFQDGTVHNVAPHVLHLA